MTATIHVGDALAVLRTLPDASVHCCVTSPPYWGLRDYGHAEQIGLEPTPDAYVEALVAVFEQVRRVLRPDGVCWLNLGDSYASTTKGSGGESDKQDSNAGSRFEPRRLALPDGLKAKDLVGIPWQVAFALRAAGWWLRAECIWAKQNPMPESITDRPTKAHEQVFLLTKSARYFYDCEAVTEPAVSAGAQVSFATRYKAQARRGVREPSGNEKPGAPSVIVHATRNMRTVWWLTSQAFSGAHFATFPEDLVDRCIRAGTSAHGCCAACGAPHARVIERTGGPPRGSHRDNHEIDASLKSAHPSGTLDGANLSRIYAEYGYATNTTVGWRPTCTCEGAGIEQCTVLDPFAGSGTTGVVAVSHALHFVGIELNPTYAAMARRRITSEAPLFVQARVDAAAAAAESIEPAGPQQPGLFDPPPAAGEEP